jgi:F0F1-type ATP synthase assembly protein I
MESKITSEFDITPVKSSVKKKKVESKMSWETRDGIYLAAPIVVGLFAGRAIDQFVGRGTIYTLVFLIAGVGASMYNLWKLTKTINK